MSTTKINRGLKFSAFAFLVFIVISIQPVAAAGWTYLYPPFDYQDSDKYGAQASISVYKQTGNIYFKIYHPSPTAQWVMGKFWDYGFIGGQYDKYKISFNGVLNAGFDSSGFHWCSITIRLGVIDNGGNRVGWRDVYYTQMLSGEHDFYEIFVTGECTVTITCPHYPWDYYAPAIWIYGWAWGNTAELTKDPGSTANAYLTVNSLSWQKI